MKGLFKSRKFRQGSLATAITAVVIALVVIINILATTLTDRYGWTLDLTPNKLFSITDETKEYLKTLDRDVKIYILDKEETFIARSTMNTQAVEVLKKYAQESAHINLEFIDYLANPTFGQDYPALQLSQNSILITCGDKARDLTASQLYDYTSDPYGYQSYATASKAEQVLTSAVLGVTSEQSINVTVISGHNEQNLSAFTTLLQDNNYLIGSTNLPVEDIDPVYNAAVIAAPKLDFSEEELKRLDDYLKNGGQYDKTLIYFADSEQAEVPNLEAFLADWGIEVGGGLVYETASNRTSAQNPFLAIVDFAEEVFSKDSQSQNIVPVVQYGRPLSMVYENKNSITTSVLLQFAGSAGIFVSQEEQTEPTGAPIPYATMSQYLTYEGTTPLKSQVLVFGSPYMVDNSILATPSYANSRYMLDLIADLCGKQDDIRIESKSLSGSTIDANDFQILLLGFVFVVALPLVVLISGLVIWARRRHR